MFIDNHLKVTVVIPAYNCVDYIQESVNSALAQTLPPFEVILIDDGSQDNTRIVLQQFIERKEIVYIRQNNRGPAAARNVGIKLSHGDVIAFLDGDDIWLRDKLEKSIKFMVTHRFDWVCTSMVKILENGDHFIKRIPNDSWVIDSETYEVKQLKNGLFFFSDVPIHTPTIVVRKRCFKTVGLFDENFIVGEDTDLWLRFEEAGLRGGYLDEPLTIYSYNKSSITKAKKIDGLHQHAMVAKKHALILGLNRPLIRNTYSGFLWQIADRYFENRQFIKSMKYIFKSLFYDPKRAFRLVKKLNHIIKV